jgi:hypothetical protein
MQRNDQFLKQFQNVDIEGALNVMKRRLVDIE